MLVLMVAQAASEDAQQLMLWLALVSGGIMSSSSESGGQMVYGFVRVVLLGVCVILSGGLPVNSVLWALLVVEVAAFVSVVLRQRTCAAAVQEVLIARP
jgi:hypothetical protein